MNNVGLIDMDFLYFRLFYIYFIVIVDDYYIVDDFVSFLFFRIGDCNIFICNLIKYIIYKVVVI